MNLSSIVDAMVSAGCTPQQIAEVVRAHCVNEEAAKAERRAKDADRQRRHRMSRDVTVTDSDERDLPLEVSLSPAPLSLPKTPSKKTPKGVQKGSRLEIDWKPSNAERQTASEMGFTESQAETEFAKFRDYWIAKPGKDGVKLDWPATLRNWLRSSAERKGIVPNAHGPPAEAVPKFETEEEFQAWWDNRRKA